VTKTEQSNRWHACRVPVIRVGPSKPDGKRANPGPGPETGASSASPLQNEPEIRLAQIRVAHIN
jgi:hypothetical protein